ncbi:MAG: peptidoglycan-binding protein [Patescibacteria group bacterium]
MKKYLFILVIIAFCFSISSAGAVGFVFNRDLSVGSKGGDVLTLQKILIENGFLNISTPTDYFGNKTKEAVKNFQAKNGLARAGKIGPATRSILNSQTLSSVTQIPLASPVVISNVQKPVATQPIIIQKEIQPNIGFSFTGLACPSSQKCVTVISPNGGEVFTTGQSITVNWNSEGFNDYRDVSVDLVKKVDSDYVTLYNFENESTDREKLDLVIPPGLESGSNYVFKVSVHNVSESEVFDYSDFPFTINAKSDSACLNPSVSISVDPTFYLSSGLSSGSMAPTVTSSTATNTTSTSTAITSSSVRLIGDYDISAGGGDNCTVRVKSIQFKSNVNILSWHTQFSDVLTSQNSNILTLEFPQPAQLSGSLVNTPIGQKVMAQVIDVWGNFDSNTSEANFINPIKIDAVDINGNSITSIVY